MNKSGTDYVFSQVNTVSANGKYYIKSADGKYLTSTGSFTDDFSQAAEWTCKNRTTIICRLAAIILNGTTTATLGL